MCKYCEPTSPIVAEYDFPGVPSGQTVQACYPVIEDSYGREPMRDDDRCVWIEGNTLFAETSGREYSDYSTQIHFCPMCGRCLDPEPKE
jgi:hypothetical protein